MRQVPWKVLMSSWRPHSWYLVLRNVEKAAFARAGLPPVFYYRSGRLKLSIGDGTERVVARPKSVTSICHLLRR